MAKWWVGKHVVGVHMSHHAWLSRLFTQDIFEIKYKDQQTVIVKQCSHPDSSEKARTFQERTKS